MTPRVLIVDDHLGFLATARRLLQAQGLSVVGVASSGTEAVGMAAELEPDVALVDVDLGEESGLDITRTLIERMPGLRVVLISTHSESDLRHLIDISPAIGFIPKSRLSAAAVLDITG